MSSIDDLLANAERYAETFDKGDAQAPPARKVVVLACMDARLQLSELLGLELGDAHMLRNGGGVVTEDVLRSIGISQRRLATEEVMIVQHTSCGLIGLDEAALEAEIGQRPAEGFGGFDDLEASVRYGVRRIRESDYLVRTDKVRGFIYDVKTGRLREVT
ncbi:MAG: carbonic anhydrase [Acidimicrobiia bacterium]|nr:carbonic anhydrase [Acidimicrobiia bacterium]